MNCGLDGYAWIRHRMHISNRKQIKINIETEVFIYFQEIQSLDGNSIQLRSGIDIIKQLHTHTTAKMS